MYGIPYLEIYLTMGEQKVQSFVREWVRGLF